LGAGSYEIRIFKPGFDALGIVVDFVTRTPPFDRFPAGALVAALKFQIAHGEHVSAFRGETLVGYFGWLPITRAVGEAWLAGKAELAAVESARADAVVLTVARVADPAALPSLVRALRKRGSGKFVYFRRDYLGGPRAHRRGVFELTDPSPPET
jgi:hypothetical protein